MQNEKERGKVCIYEEDEDTRRKTVRKRDSEKEKQ